VTDYAGTNRWRCYYEICSLTAAICYYCRVRGFVDGRPMSSSERSGGFRGWSSFAIAATDPSYITDGFTACLMTFCASHTDGYPYLATSCQRYVDLPGTMLQVQTPTDELYQSKGDPSVRTHVSDYWMRVTGLVIRRARPV